MLKIVSLLDYLCAFSGGSDGKESAWNAGDTGLNPGLGRSARKEMATHSQYFVWRTPWTEESGGLQSMGATKSDTTEQFFFFCHTMGQILVP